MRVRHGLLVRLLAAVVLVALCSITATAWLAAQSTSGAIRREQGQTLADDARINDTLLGYAAVHPSWEGVEPVVRRLARETGRRIALTTEDRRPIADSAGPRASLPARASAVVDPLRVDVSLTPGAAADRIDPRAVGPFRLPTAELARLRKAADAHAECLRRDGQNARVVYGLSGRPAVQIGSLTQPLDMADPGAPAAPPAPRPAPCTQPPSTAVTQAEQTALARLDT
ncbi:MAG TPA: two-component sensor histidine kinase, partial [Thermomonospora sp.]|nr:two-component sensor histidine kinase [Thermomonospora sp.]